ncbi:MAG: hypothetical protein IPL53_14580 [Ignavibacteria bacterium]|nr:hypothetical protein [Ignavibacteria bacterium]
MTKFIILLSLIIINTSLMAQTINQNYDSALAKSFNADDYGMKKYVLVMLKPGSNNTTDKTIIDSIFGGHMKNINRLAENGSLIVAGPIMKSEKYRGIFILNVETIDEAKTLLETDPAISEKFLEADLYQWYGSAALKDYLKTHKLIEKYSF